MSHIDSQGNNLDSDGSSGFTHGVNGDLLRGDPLFVSGTNFQLQSCSPAVNTGKDASNATALDIIGNPRKFGVIDMEAYELQQVPANPALSAGDWQVAKTIEPNDALLFAENCTMLASLRSGGTNPVEGNVKARVWVQTDHQPTYNGQPYVQRRYEIAPDENASLGRSSISIGPSKPGLAALSLSLSAARPGDLEVRLINALGQTTLQQTFGLSAGPNSLSMDVGNLGSGMYFLHYRMGVTSGFLRVLKE